MARRAARRDAARSLAIEAARIAEDRHCEDILILDLRGTSPVTDYFVIATGTSGRQVSAVAKEIADAGKASGQKVWQTAGLEQGDWVVLDFVDVVVHLFQPALRRYYDLELIWGDAPRVRYRRRAASRPKSREGNDAQPE